jgi:hypothetical protein
VIDLDSIPAAFDVYECAGCNGAGSKHDPTMADWVGGNGSGAVLHEHCRGRGVVTHPAGWNGWDAFAGRLLRGNPASKPEPTATEPGTGKTPEWMCEW